MAATIAHEISNPLESVMNLLYLLRPKITDAEGLNYLSTAESELSRVSHIAKQTLGASAKSISLGEIVQHAISIYEPRCLAANIKIKTSFRYLRKIVLRRGEMMQVLSNLITNAIYAMSAGGVLSVSVEEVQGSPCGIVLAVQDDGVGIAADDLPRVFDAFSTTRSTSGTAIGLFVAKQFVEGHDGQIRIESQNDPARHGTMVSVLLPLCTTYDVPYHTVAHRRLIRSLSFVQPICGMPFDSNTH